MMLIAVTLAVSAIPEALPLSVTIAFAVGASRLARRSALIRSLPAVESLGAVEVICTDKTGTLTTGIMTAVKLVAGSTEYEITGEGNQPHGKFINSKSQQNVDAKQLRKFITATTVQMLPVCWKMVNVIVYCAFVFVCSAPSARMTLLLGSLCNNTSYNFDNKINIWIATGTSTETPLTVASAKAGFFPSELQTFAPKIDEIPFSSATKMMVTTHRIKSEELSQSKTKPAETTQQPNEEHHDDEGEISIDLPTVFASLPNCSNISYLTAVKGAPNMLLKRCTATIDDTGRIVKLTDEMVESLLHQVDHLSSQALRVLAVAYQTDSEDQTSKHIKKGHHAPQQSITEILSQSNLTGVEKLNAQAANLIFAGFYGIQDPARDGIKEAIATAASASIRTIMITGDYKLTAVAIAKNIGLIPVNTDPQTDPIARDAADLRPSSSVNASGTSQPMYLSHNQLDEMVRTTDVFARATPQDKLEIVKSLKRLGKQTAMTGDGINGENKPSMKT